MRDEQDRDISIHQREFYQYLKVKNYSLGICKFSLLSMDYYSELICLMNNNDTLYLCKQNIHFESHQLTYFYQALRKTWTNLLLMMQKPPWLTYH